ncbi:MAG: urease accessory protein UreD [Candidatus Tectomicrobia bacterium]|uniref:Urease accessory protein UreD n=1 Tax=Tectimicrobiota bacterium TaxID=2528274 RepID=A0A933LQR9_UNCTE|nr:urease accessory protein UreD [Candidatus Tectomicrobia bacterium]
MHSKEVPEERTRIGKDGYLFLQFKKEGNKTVLADSFSRIPLQTLPPFYLDNSAAAYNYILNPTGGIVGGDNLEVEIRLEPEAHAFLTTPSATKVYKTVGPPAQQRLVFFLKRDSVLEYLPRVTIPFASSSFSQNISLFLEEGARAILLDIFNTGRKARGEHLAFNEYRSIVEAFEADLQPEQLPGQLMALNNFLKGARSIDSYVKGARPLLSDRLLLRPHDVDYSGLGFFGAFSTTATIYLIFNEPALESSLSLLFQSILEEQKKNKILGGVSLLPRKGLFVRILGHDAHQIEQVILLLWSIARKEMLAIYEPSLTRLF